MSRVCVHINKIKSMGTLKSRWNHDINKQFRKEHVSNADADRYSDDDILQPALMMKEWKYPMTKL